MRLLHQINHMPPCISLLSTFISLYIPPNLIVFSFKGKAVRRQLLERYFGADSVMSHSKNLIQNIKTESESKKKDYVFDSELRPLRNISLFEVQCKLNSSGACGKSHFN
jgi:hypothetical protein